MICKADFTNLQASDDLCFVVRPEVPDGAEISIFGERAEVCVDIRLDYDAESCNCETFANAVHGNWGQGVQASFKRKIQFTWNPTEILSSAIRGLLRGKT